MESRNIAFLVLSSVRNYSKHNSSGYPSILFLGPEERRALMEDLRSMPWNKELPDLMDSANDRCFNYQGMTVFYLASNGCYAGHACEAYDFYETKAEIKPYLKPRE